MTANEFCRVCGYRPGGEPPYDAKGRGLQEICPCCGVQWGYQDGLPQGARRFREAWLARGAPWRMPEFRPPDWDLSEQLSHVPEAYRSTSMSTNAFCRICGYRPDGRPPYDAEGYGSHDICPCCGAQWGLPG